MDSSFMPLSLDMTGAAATYNSTSSVKGKLTEEDLEDMGINIVDPDKDMGLDFTDYLQLMVQQLQNQTIDNTTDASEMLNQLVQMSTVEMLGTVQDGLEALVNASTLSYAASLVGKTVTVGKYDDEGNLEEIVGEVTGTGSYQGTAVIFVNGEMYSLSSIMAVGTLPEVPDPEPEPPEGGDGGGGNTDGGTDNGETEKLGGVG